jgi:signal transduction histidine kinase
MQKILVIDDEQDLRELMVMTLRKQGYDVFEADNADAGIDLARGRLPDLILCDVCMSEKDGYATLNALRTDPATTTIPVILMTGQPDNAGMRQGMSLGADDYLAKPFTAPELTAAVAARLHKQQALRQQAEQKLADLRANITMALPHELFTPLSGIVGFADLIIADAQHLQPDEIVKIGRTLQTCCNRLHRLIENFLLYAQIELLKADPASQQNLQLQCTERTAELVEIWARGIADKAGRLPDLSLNLQPARANIQEDYLQKILSELLENAFKFSSKGAVVVVSSGPGEDGYRLSIQDHGLGMTSRQIAHVGAYMQFERKLHEQQGSGLGLAIAKRFAELHGGSLSLQSAPGAGTTVLVTLPDHARTPAS